MLFFLCVKPSYLPEHVTTKLTEVLVTSADDTFKILLGNSLYRARGGSVETHTENSSNKQLSFLKTFIK